MNRSDELASQMIELIAEKKCRDEKKEQKRLRKQYEWFREQVRTEARPPGIAVVPGSVTGHCCFEWSVVNGEELICETMDKDYAEQIASCFRERSDSETLGHLGPKEWQ